MTEHSQKKLIKFNMYASCILLSFFVIMLVATTIAYFTVNKEVRSTFVSGNVELVLSEAAVKADAAGNYVADPDSPPIIGTADSTIHDYGKVYPGQSIFKNPTVTNTGDNAEWIAVKVILTDGAGDLTKVIGYEGYEDIDIELLLSGGLLDETVHFGTWNGIEDVCHNDRYAMIQKANEADGIYEFYFLMLQPLQPEETVTVFDHITFPAEWNNSEMQELAELKIQVQAFGVQTSGLNSCLGAMTAAFPEHFHFS